MELKEQFEAFAVKLEGKSKEEVKTAIEAFAIDNQKAIEVATEEVKAGLLTEIQTLKDNAVTMQAHTDSLDMKLQSQVIETGEPKDVITEAIKSNFEQIEQVKKGGAIELEVKDMTLGNALTGDQPRDYNFDVVKRPFQMVNVDDLATSVTISGGTYTYVRSTLASGTVVNQTEGALKAQLEYDYTMVDANTDFLAGFAVYSKKMKNNLPFLESTLSIDLRNDYARGENAAFQTILASQATASTQIITGQNQIEMLIAEIATLAGNDFATNGIVVRPEDYYKILVTEKSTGAGYGLPGIVTYDGGVLRINGVAVVMATWLPANKYYVGNWSRVRKVITEGFSLTFSEDDADNFRKNNITAKVEAQVTLTVEQPDALVYGDFTAV